MNFTNIHFIINPAAGKEEPIVSFINRAFEESMFVWDIAVTHKDTDIDALIKTLAETRCIIAAYGGDGSVTKIAKALHGTNTPLAIIPGGTANVMAKELGIPTDSMDALRLLASGQFEIKAIDMGTVNGTPFLLRVNLGIMAEMVLQTDSKLKDNLGQLAYGVTAFRTIADAEPIDFDMVIDGVEVNETGLSLTVTNSGNIGISDFALQPGISVTDGLLDIILVQHNDFFTLFKIAGSTLLQNATDAVMHWKCKNVLIRLKEPLTYVCDDCEQTAAMLDIRVAPHSIKIVVPVSQ